MKEKEKIIGIVGGMGPRAGLALHEAILNQTNAKNDQDHLCVAHLSFSKFVEDRTKYLEDRTLENPAHSIVKIIQLLNNSGASIIGIPCNTSHVPAIFNTIQAGLLNKGIKVNIKHMINETANYAKANFSQVKKIAVMSTNGTYKSGIYNKALQQKGFEVFIPEKQIQDKVIHRMIYDPEFGIKSTATVKAPVEDLLNEALHYFKENKVEAVVLGCTEFSLVPKDKFKSLYTIDSVEVLAKSLVSEVRSNSKELAF